MFIASLFVVTKCKQINNQEREINKLYYSHIIEYYITAKMKALVTLQNYNIEWITQIAQWYTLGLHLHQIWKYSKQCYVLLINMGICSSFINMHKVSSLKLQGWWVHWDRRKEDGIKEENRVSSVSVASILILFEESEANITKYEALKKLIRGVSQIIFYTFLMLKIFRKNFAEESAMFISTCVCLLPFTCYPVQSGSVS